MSRETLSRQVAKARLATLQATRLSPDECEDIVEDWPVVEGDPEWQTLPEDLRAELSHGPCPPDKAHLPRYRPLVLAGLVGSLRGVRNAWLAAELERAGHAPVVVEGAPDLLAACPCCGFLTLDEPLQWDICRVCFWEDAPGDGGPNRVTLDEARHNFADFGACARRNVEHVLPDGPQRYPREGTRVDVIIRALVAASTSGTSVELAERLDALSSGGLSQFSLVSYFKRAFPEIPLRALIEASAWHRLSGGGISDAEFDAALGPWLPRRSSRER